MKAQHKIKERMAFLNKRIELFAQLISSGKDKKGTLKNCLRRYDRELRKLTKELRKRTEGLTHNPFTCLGQKGE